MTLRQFANLNEERQAELLPILKVVKPLANYKRGWIRRRRHGVERSLMELSFARLNRVRKLVESGDIKNVLEAVRLVYNDNPAGMNVVRFYRCVVFITKELKRIAEMEAAHWAVEPTEYDGTLQAAGVDALQQFGTLPMIDSLAGGDPLKYDAIEALPYQDVHVVLWYRAMQANVQNRFHKLMKNRS